MGVEYGMRVFAYRTSVSHSPGLWHYWRGKVYSGSDTVVILGSSRIKNGFSLSVFRERYPRVPVVQLAVGGANPQPVLHDLANDEEFNGLVIYDMMYNNFGDSERGAQGGYVDAYHQGYNLNDYCNMIMRAFLQDHFILLHQSDNLRNLLISYLKTGEWAEPSPIRRKFDRSSSVAYSAWSGTGTVRQKKESELRKKIEDHQRVNAEEFLLNIVDVIESVKKIKARGGDVVFVVMPVSPLGNEYYELYYPRKEFWDQFAAAVLATCIHFQDYEGLNRFECPDTSHLDASDIDAFTNNLLDVLDQKRFFRTQKSLP
jgi:hypothetical protein